MKKINFILTIFSILIVFGSCKKFLEVIPKDQVNDGILWENPENADLFLNFIYAGIPSHFTSEDPWENFSDNSMNGINWATSRTTYANSAYTAQNAPSRWGLYSQIRKCNLFIERVQGSNLPQDWKTIRLGEARFLRAYFYMMLWNCYGGVPIITDVLNISEQGDDVFRPRNTAEETYQFIVSECEAIVNDLPLHGAQPGRITRGAALALKGWTELYWASPLYNPQNDLGRWSAAANTNRRIMELGTYELYWDFNSLHFEENNNNVEVIFDRQHLGGTPLGGNREGIQGPWIVHGMQHAWGGVDPSQELVNDYAMSNGFTIDDPRSGYDPQNPYVGREKRFYQSIVFDGADWLGDIMIMKQGVGSRNATDLSNVNEATNTGYYLRKGLDPKYAINGNHRMNSASFIIFRFAEVLLSYAEAKNEADGPGWEIYSAVNRVRVRSGLPELEVGLNQEQMRKAIHRERRVELAFEEKRLFDLFRWKKAEEKLNGSIHAIVIEQENGVWVYKQIPAPGGSRRFYPEKNYLLPIPQTAIDRNEQLVQNPNY